ncbi:MAG TPA: MBL fold metallo-hydrolase [Planctomycetaceae bacterium]|nr:MBL fold metallo-hydrolase [Planctomycetaceae bacterium]
MDIADDGSCVAVATMAFRHDRNFWLLAAETGEVRWGRYLETWAPCQVRTLANAKGFAVGLTYGPDTVVASTVALFQGEKDAVLYAYDRPLQGGRGWLRYGAGEWRTGWPTSVPADLFARAGTSFFASANPDRNHGPGVAWKYDGAAPKPLNMNCPFRMGASADGKVVAFGYAVHDFHGADTKVVKRFDAPPTGMVTVRAVENAEHVFAKDLWTAGPADDAPAAPKPPEPSADFPVLADDFNMQPLGLVPFRIPMSLAVSGDGSRVAVTEYGGHARVGRERIFPDWSPLEPVSFLSRQRGLLRVFAAPGKELAKAELPQDGLFDVHLDRAGGVAWCVPASWFARGLAGCPWLPADETAGTVFVYDVERKAWKAPWRFPDAVADFAAGPDGTGSLVSCWDGMLYLLDRDGGVLANLQVGGPARVRWSQDGKFAIVGTQDGTVVRVGADGKEVWRKQLPAAEAALPVKEFAPVFKDVPVYSVGRWGPEHAYVGDIWLIKTSEGGILVDTGGVSALPVTWKLIQAAGIDPKQVRYVLLSHSHGDHAGAAYLWRAQGAKVVAPASAAFAVTGIMPTWSHYNLWVPCPIDEPLPLKKAGDEAEVTLCGVKIKAIFAPGHSPDSVVYVMELNGKRVIFTGDIAFDDRRPGLPLGSNILHRCWGDPRKAARIVEVIETQVLPLRPEFNFTGHGAHADATALWGRILEASRAALQGKKELGEGK